MWLPSILMLISYLRFRGVKVGGLLWNLHSPFTEI
jgi:hypothetical protein